MVNSHCLPEVRTPINAHRTHRNLLRSCTQHIPHPGKHQKPLPNITHYFKKNHRISKCKTRISVKALKHSVEGKDGCGTSNVTSPCERTQRNFLLIVALQSQKTKKFRKIIVRYKRIGYNINIMRQSACLVFNPITV